MSTHNPDEEHRSSSCQSFRQAFGGLLFLTGLFYFNFTSRVIFSPLLPEIEKELGVDHAAAGSLFLFISAGYFISILSSSFVSARLNHKRTIVLSLICSGIMLFWVGLSNSLHTLQGTLFALGLAAGLYLPSALASISTLVAPAYLGRGMAIHEFAPNIGFMTAPLLAGLMLSCCSYQAGLQLFGFLMICCGIIYWFSKHGSSEKEKRPDWSAVITLLKRPPFWSVTILFMLGISSTLGIYSMLPLYLHIEHEMAMDKVNNLLAFSRFLSVLAVYPSGLAGDRFGSRLVIIVVLGIGGVLTLMLGFFSGWLLGMIVVLQAMLAVCFFPAGFALLSRIAAPGQASMTISLAIPLAFLVGGGLAPTVIGLTGDYYSIAYAFVCCGLTITGGAVFAFCALQKKR